MFPLNHPQLRGILPYTRILVASFVAHGTLWDFEALREYAPYKAMDIYEAPLEVNARRDYFRGIHPKVRKDKW